MLRGLARGDAVLLTGAELPVGLALAREAASVGAKAVGVVSSSLSGAQAEEAKKRVTAATGGKGLVLTLAELKANMKAGGKDLGSPKLALDGVGAADGAMVFHALAPKGKMIVYGAAPGNPCRIPLGHHIFKGCSAEGFNILDVEK